MQANDNEFLFKIILVGDAGVGKSSLLARYCKDQFGEDYNVTVGVEFHSQEVYIDEQTAVKLQIWDTVKYFQAKKAEMATALGWKESFESLQSWLEEARENCDENAVFVLMGNQADREEEREVQYSEGEAFMKENNMNFFFETSALNSQNIEIAFKEASKLIFLNYLSKLTKSRTTSVASSVDGNQPSAPGKAEKKGKIVLTNTKPGTDANGKINSGSQGCNC